MANFLNSDYKTENNILQYDPYGIADRSKTGYNKIPEKKILFRPICKKRRS